MVNFVSQLEFSKMLGVNPRTIRRHIENGKIFDNALNEKRQINPIVAMEQLDATLSGRGGKREGLGGDPEKLDRLIPKGTNNNLNSPQNTDFYNKMQSDSDARMYLKSRAEKEVISAKMAELDLKEREQTLIKKESVRKALFNYGRAARDKLMSVGTRLAPVLAHKTSEHDIKMMIDAEIREAIDDLMGAYKDYETVV